MTIWWAVMTLACATTSLSGQVYDLSKEFATANKPGAHWQLGYSTGTSLASVDFRTDTYSEVRNQYTFWHPQSTASPGPGYYPYVAYNATDQTRLEPTKGWAARAREITMEGSNTGQYSIVRFLAPAAGEYTIEAEFTGIHFNLSTTDVHVLRNSESLFASEVDGYGGDPAFHKVEGSHPTAPYSGVIMLKAGDVITFAVGYGRNRTHYNDTTGLLVKLTKR